MEKEEFKRMDFTYRESSRTGPDGIPSTASSDVSVIVDDDGITKNFSAGATDIAEDGFGAALDVVAIFFS
jgi:hypothetical protein